MELPQAAAACQQYIRLISRNVLAMLLIGCYYRRFNIFWGFDFIVTGGYKIVVYAAHFLMLEILVMLFRFTDIWCRGLCRNSFSRSSRCSPLLLQTLGLIKQGVTGFNAIQPGRTMYGHYMLPRLSLFISRFRWFRNARDILFSIHIDDAKSFSGSCMPRRIWWFEEFWCRYAWHYLLIDYLLLLLLGNIFIHYIRLRLFISLIFFFIQLFHDTYIFR